MSHVGSMTFKIRLKIEHVIFVIYSYLNRQLIRPYLGRRRIHGKTTGWILIGSTRLFSHFRAVALVVTNVTRGRVTCDAVTRCSAVTDLLGKSHEQFKIFCCTPVMSPTVMEDGTLPYFQMM